MKQTTILALLLVLCLCLSACAMNPGSSASLPDSTEAAPTEPAATTPESAGPAESTAPIVPDAEEPFNMAAAAAEIDSMEVTDFEESAEPTDYVRISVRDFGEIVVRLRPDVAPISAQNFQDLVARHYYDGTVFHRVYPGFMIQGGAGTEELTPITGEFASNGIQNPLLHIRGVISMARTDDKNSATSQFFLMHADSDFLDGNYAAFGYIVAGLSTVDRICEIELGYNPYSGELSVPMVDVIIESAVFVTPKN